MAKLMNLPCCSTVSAAEFAVQGTRSPFHGLFPLLWGGQQPFGGKPLAGLPLRQRRAHLEGSVGIRCQRTACRWGLVPRPCPSKACYKALASRPVGMVSFRNLQNGEADVAARQLGYAGIWKHPVSPHATELLATDSQLSHPGLRRFGQASERYLSTSGPRKIWRALKLVQV